MTRPSTRSSRLGSLRAGRAAVVVGTVLLLAGPAWSQRPSSPARPVLSDEVKRVAPDRGVEGPVLSDEVKRVVTDQGVEGPDLNGFWINQYTPDLSVALGKQPPFTELGAERWRTVDTSKDPTGICLPVGPSRGFTAPFPFLLVQQADTVSILFEYQSIWRAIYLDGRGHPEDVAEYPYFMGHSIGHWEGDTLVVDTTGIDERSWLDTAGHEHSAQLRLTERFQKTGADTIQWTATYEDPIYFTRPWSITRTFTRGKPGDRLLPYTCNENNKDVEHLRTNQPNLNYKHVPEPKTPPKPR